MLQAAASNLIDFKEAKSNDRAWYKKLRLLLDSVERNNYIEYLKIKTNINCAMLVRSEDGDMAAEILNNLESIETDFKSTLFPYLVKRSNKDNNVIEVNKERNTRLVNEWEKLYGRIDDPATQKKINDSIKFLEDMGKKRKAGK
mgnify:CR=1 FL=1